MSYLRSRYWKDMPISTILWKISFQLIFIAFISINGFSQEKVSENPVTNQNQSTVVLINNHQTIVSDSLKKVEAKRIYMIPVETLKENQGKINSNPPPTAPK